EALRCDGSDEEPMMIEGDSDDDEGTIPVSRGFRRALEHSSTLLISPLSTWRPVLLLVRLTEVPDHMCKARL
ncbi:hypothetical protein PIB30_113715, partial [Stylosanthes scabra]|nr:hypothetical protein [Stylosanthes scabra]